VFNMAACLEGEEGKAVWLKWLTICPSEEETRSAGGVASGWRSAGGELFLLATVDTEHIRLAAMESTEGGVVSQFTPEKTPPPAERPGGRRSAGLAVLLLPPPEVESVRAGPAAGQLGVAERKPNEFTGIRSTGDDVFMCSQLASKELKCVKRLVSDPTQGSGGALLAKVAAGVADRLLLDGSSPLRAKALVKCLFRVEMGGMGGSAVKQEPMGPSRNGSPPAGSASEDRRGFPGKMWGC